MWGSRTRTRIVIHKVMAPELEMEWWYLKIWFQNYIWNCNSQGYDSKTETGTVITSGYRNNTNA